MNIRKRKGKERYSWIIWIIPKLFLLVYLPLPPFNIFFIFQIFDEEMLKRKVKVLIYSTGKLTIKSQETFDVSCHAVEEDIYICVSFSGNTQYIVVTCQG